MKSPSNRKVSVNFSNQLSKIQSIKAVQEEEEPNTNSLEEPNNSDFEEVVIDGSISNNSTFRPFLPNH
jgi:hypothetical protein